MTTAKTNTAVRLIRSTAELRECARAARAAGATLGLVPTMGALHAGHLSLLDASRRDCDLTIVTIFVNPTQFAAGEDFSRYPRTLEADLELLAPRGADIVFAPDTAAMYTAQHATSVDVQGPALRFEGEHRPTHFRGVATIVLKLLNLVQPDRAYFGRKDYQQALVVRRLVADLDVPTEIITCPIVRDADGLALSSRNRYLNADERSRALALRQCLRQAADLVSAGQRDTAALCAAMRATLLAAPVEIDYVAICDPDTLEPLTRVDARAVALVAARVGTTRLIDNELLG